MEHCSEQPCRRPVRKCGMCDTHYAWAKRNGTLPVISMTACAVCGVLIVPNSRKPRRFCSAQCLRDHHNPIKNEAAKAERSRRRDVGEPSMYSEREREVRRINDHRRRARRVGARSERVSHRAVFERDNWVCGLCGDPVDPSVKWPSLMSASLDHVVPLARGGSHTYDNVQLAHSGCNIRVGVRKAAS